MARPYVALLVILFSVAASMMFSPVQSSMETKTTQVPTSCSHQSHSSKHEKNNGSRPLVKRSDPTQPELNGPSFNISSDSGILPVSQGTMGGGCPAGDDSPAWQESGRRRPSVIDQPTVTEDSSGGLPTANSSLWYKATGLDLGARYRSLEINITDGCLTMELCLDVRHGVEELVVGKQDVRNKAVGDDLYVEVEVEEVTKCDGPIQVSWTKDGQKIASPEPVMRTLSYTDAGRYECRARAGYASIKIPFILVVEGRPVITSLTRLPDSTDGTIRLVCEALAVPEPIFKWSSYDKKSYDKSSYDKKDGKATNKVYMEDRPWWTWTWNTPVTCQVSNDLGEDARSISLQSVSPLTIVVCVLPVLAVLLVVVYCVRRPSRRRKQQKGGGRSNTLPDVMETSPSAQPTQRPASPVCC